MSGNRSATTAQMQGPTPGSGGTAVIRVRDRCGFSAHGELEDEAAQGQDAHAAGRRYDPAMLATSGLIPFRTWRYR